MAPESLNYRKFSTKSDVWMFGVCIWEILTHGVKPWQNIRNHDVIVRVERGELLEQPAGCPKALYDLLRSMWILDPQFRISTAEVLNYLGHLLDEIDHGVPFEELSPPDVNILRSSPESDGCDRRERRRSVPVFNVGVCKSRVIHRFRTGQLLLKLGATFFDP